MSYDPKTHPHTIITVLPDGSCCLTIYHAAWEARYPGHSVEQHIAERVASGDAVLGCT